MIIMLNRNGFNFFSSGLRQKVDQLMDILYSGGVNNPMDSIEQISYLLFLRLLTEKDDVLGTLDRKYERIFSGKWARLAWETSLRSPATRCSMPCAMPSSICTNCRS